MTLTDKRRRRRIHLPPPAAPDSKAPLGRRAAIGLTLALFALVFSVLSVVSYRQNSATWDEPVHLTTGYAALAERDYRVEPTHPPFIRMWAALPLLFMPDIRLDTGAIDRVAPIDWHSGSVAYDFSSRFLFVENDADRLLNAARFMIVILGIVLGVLVFSWTYEWLGFAPAACTLIFYSLSPTLLAHASLVTTDVGIACFIFGTIYFLWRTCRQVSAFNVGGMTLFFALAIVSKFSAVILGPVVVCLLLASGRRRVPARTAVALVLLLAVASYAAVWAVYGFRYAPSASPAWILELEEAPLARTVPAVASVTGWVDEHRLLPNMFTEGFLMFAQSMEPPVRTFLAGAYSDEGWWYYYPVALVLKMPLPLTVLLVVGAVFCVRRRRELGGQTGLFILVTIVFYLAAGVMNTYQVGIRHMLPLFPFFIMTAAAGAMALLRSRSGRVALAGVGVFWIAVVAGTYPHTLTFFNTAVGGAPNGYKYLADSNIDWGQGLKLLKGWMDREGVSHVGLAYYGTADPAYYGISYTALPSTPGFELPSIDRPWRRPPMPGYVAVSATVLTGAYLHPHWRMFYAGLRETEPATVLGNSIFVYWLDRWPDVPASAAAAARGVEHGQLGDELLKAEWFNRAALHYRRYLEDEPDQPSALIKLGVALVATDRASEAVDGLRRGIALAPDNGMGHLTLAAALYDIQHPDVAEVVRHARRGAELMPANPGALLMLGRALAVSGELAEALEVLDRAAAIDPADPRIRDLQQRIRTATAVPAQS